jgi:hypothetical protein
VDASKWFEKIDKSSTSAPSSPPGRTRDESEELCLTRTLNTAPAVPEIIATKPE